ncbi:hypothetical protein ILT44_19740 [Microvirga sp. BT689]|uniref:hypothetical protein n=1 Tax=Microvirga arvi TaxID=2778731 RepID=UPI001951E52C|nr:hypothetical protein [Microvirga arvi]MBM6582442.1 hypothetical protein [Microvirga arvi]
MISQVENVARAFYDAKDDGQSWEQAPENIKEEFRLYAREAIMLHSQLQLQKSDAAVESMLGSLSVAA